MDNIADILDGSVGLVQILCMLLLLYGAFLSALAPSLPDKFRSRLTRSSLMLLAALATGTTATVVDGNSRCRGETYEYTAEEVSSAAAKDLDAVLAPFRLAGTLNRNTPEFVRASHLLTQVANAAAQQSEAARNVNWTLFMHEGRFEEAYSRAGGKIVMSTKFLDTHRPSDDELAFVIGHEMAHVLCEHERIALSVVWNRNAPHKLPARHAMEFLDTEPLVRRQVAPIGRLHERVADRLGLELAAATGFSPQRALNFFDKTAASGQYRLFPDVHDPNVERKTALLKNAAALQTADKTRVSHGLNCSP